MKLKGISVFEQHIEKVFAAIIFIALLAILAMQFLGAAATVTVAGPTKREVPLNQAWDAVAENARGVQAKLDSTRVPEQKDAQEATKQIVSFLDTYRGPLTPSKSLAIAVGESANVGNIGAATGSSIAPLAELVAPAPSTPYGSSHLTLVAPFEAEGKPEVAAILPAKMPFDKAGVTVEATFNGRELMDALTADPDGSEGPIRVMPRHWWEGSIQIVDVELEREELSAAGEWTGLKTIDPIPGKASLRPELAKPMEGAAQLKEFARFATEYSDVIRRPPYYASAMGEKWLTPSDRREMDEKLAAQQGNADDATRTRRQIEAKQADSRRVEQEIERLAAGGGAKPPRPSPAPKPGGGGGGGKGIGGGPGGGGAGPREPREQPKDTTELQRKRLESTLTKLRAELATLIARLSAMGEDVSMYGPQEAGGAPQTDPNAANKPDAPLLENPSVRIWSHDVFVERGKTYRYRLRAVLNNPMFGQGNVMVPEQQEWSKTPIIRSEPSEWSDPVRVDDETYFFITSANAADRLNRTPGARAEMFIFKWGRWRKGDVQLEPGDRLRAELKYPDVSMLLAQLPAGNPDQPPVPGFPAIPGAEPGGGGGKRLPGQPPAPSPAPNPSQQDNRRPDGREPLPPPPGAGNRPDQPAGAKPPPLPMLTEKVSVDAIFLSVAAASQVIEANANSRSGTVAYLRDSLGEVVPRYPDSERGSIVLARLKHSAEQGERETQPNEPPKPNEPPRPRPRPDEPKTPDGGGGGGGGA